MEDFASCISFRLGLALFSHPQTVSWSTEMRMRGLPWRATARMRFCAVDSPLKVVCQTSCTSACQQTVSESPQYTGSPWGHSTHPPMESEVTATTTALGFISELSDPGRSGNFTPLIAYASHERLRNRICFARAQTRRIIRLDKKTVNRCETVGMAMGAKPTCSACSSRSSSPVVGRQ